MKRTVVSIIMALCLALSLTACDSNQDKDISSTQATSSNVVVSSNIESSAPVSSNVPTKSEVEIENMKLAKTVSELKPRNIEAIPGTLGSLTGFDYSQYVVVSKNDKMGIADLTGNILLPVRYDKISLCFEGIAVDEEIYSDDLKTHSFHNGHGLETDVLCWDTVSNRPFNLYIGVGLCDIKRDNLTPCAVRKIKIEETKKDEYIEYDLTQLSGKYGFMKNWKLITDLEYDSVHEFSDGLAAVKKDGLWGYINEDGKVVIDFQFDDISQANIDYSEIIFEKAPPYNFVNGYAAVCHGSNWGYIDKTGKEVTPFDYYFAVPVYKNKAWVDSEKEGWHVIDVK